MAENGGVSGAGRGDSPWARFLFLRSVQVVTAFWVLATIAVFLIVGDGELPFGERPSARGRLAGGAGDKRLGQPRHHVFARGPA